MAIVFLDEFDGSGILEGRVPDVGPAWGSPLENTYGVVSGGRLCGVEQFSTRFFGGYMSTPARGYGAMTIRFSYQLASNAGVNLELFATQNMYGSLFRIDNEFGAQTRFLLTPTPELNSIALAPGEHEVIITFDYVLGIVTCYLDGAEVLTQTIPGDSIEEDYQPSPGQVVRYSFSGGNSFMDTANRVYGLRLEINDEFYQPETPGFWTQRVRCQEVV